MLPRQYRVFSIIVPDRVRIIQTVTGGQVYGCELPELIHGNLRVQHSLLPWYFYCRMIVRRWWASILLKNYRLACSSTDSIVFYDPRGSPGFVVTPCEC